MKLIVKNLILVFLFFLAIAAIFSLTEKNYFEKPEEVSLSKIVSQIEKGEVDSITVEADELTVYLKEGRKETALKEKDASLTTTLKNMGLTEKEISRVEIKNKGASGWSLFATNVLPILLPFLLIGAFFWFMFRQARRGQSQAFMFGKTKARLFSGSDKEEEVDFDDVGGIKEAKDELKEVIEFLKNSQKFLSLGAKPPRGVLLVGPPGCGKTLLARAVANEADVPFFNLSGSEFVEMFVGVGASVSYDTPVLIKTGSSTKLLPIGEFVDQFYEEKEDGGYMVPVDAVKTLGYNSLETGFRGVTENSEADFFGNSAWSDIQGVYRHKVDEIYEVEYLGGKIKTTGDHSVFVRHKNFIKSKEVRNLEPGDILVNLPFKVRGRFVPEVGTTHKVKAHNFSEEPDIKELQVWAEGEGRKKAYQFALAKKEVMTQKGIAQKVGVHQTTVGAWQRGEQTPLHLEVTPIPEKVRVTPALMWLMGVYTAEGRGTNNLEFTFGIKEKRLHQKCVRLMKEIFDLDAVLQETEDNTLKIKYYSAPLGRFFAKHCGNGSHNKHIPGFLWEMPKDYFLGYLEGYSDGDGYTTKDGKLSISSTSSRLIYELVWLSSMHGIKAGVKEEVIPGGRVIKNKPLPDSRAWTFIVGKTAHPFLDEDIESPKQYKKPIVRKVTKKSYDGYVYDLCGCENEAFFGGKNPILLHNSRVRDTFKVAKKNAPSILFIDELDAIGRQRGAGLGGGHDEREQTLNQILTEMDGFKKDTKVIIMAATNRPDILDPALLRPGRFDRRVTIDNPDIKDREEILKIHARNKPLAEDVKLRELAERTPGFSGADLENLINEAAILTAMRGRKKITQEALLESVEKVLLGRERESRILTEEEKKISAYHEAGHALVAASLPDTDPVHKVSIVSRGQTGGYTLKLPTEDKHFKSRKEFLADLASLLGGYAAEKIVFKDLTTGASNDLQRASDVARKIVTRYGMSEKLGPVTFGKGEDLVFLGKELHEDRNYSEKVAAKIDGEVSRLIKNAHKKAKNILEKNKKKLKEIADVLIKRETIEKEEFQRLVGDLKEAMA